MFAAIFDLVRRSSESFTNRSLVRIPHCASAERATSGSLQDNSEFLGKLFLRNVLQVMPGMT
jgi:hypothetical protein